MRAAAALTILAAATVFGVRAIYEPDLSWHLAHGREILTGHLVRTNLFSFTFPDYRQHFTSWLFDGTAYLAWQTAGAAGIQALHALILTVTFWLVTVASRVRTASASLAGTGAAAGLAVLLLGLFVVEPRAIPRPHLVSFAGLALVVLLVERAIAARSAAPLRWAVPVVALWSNVHVECVFGVLFLAIFAVAERVRPAALSRRDAWRAIAIAALCAAAMLANPYGVGIVRYLYENLSVPSILDIAELRPPYLPSYRAFFVYLAVLAVVMLSQPRELRLWEVLVAVTFAALGAKHLRLTPLVFLATAPMLAARFALFIAHGFDGRALVVTAVAAAAVVARVPVPALVSELRAGADAVEPPAFFSSKAIDFIRTAGLRGPVFNSHSLGGYLAWHLYPDVRIFQDGRLQAYPPEHFARIRRAERSQAEWDALVAAVDWAVISVPRPVELSGAGRFPTSGWATVFRDDAIEILVRKGGKYLR